jgi:hypothetical protein
MKVCYTCISGGYDLPKPIRKTEGWRYVLFTNQPMAGRDSEDWEIVLVEDSGLLGLDQTRFARYHKHNPHKVLSAFDSDISLWVDGNLTVNANLDNVLQQLGEFEFVSANHPKRNCIYDEAMACIKQNKDDHSVISKQVQQYEREGFPRNFGLLQSMILFRKHNQENIREFQELWWNEVLSRSKRDQLSFNYIMWKRPDLINHKMLNAKIMLFDQRFFPIGKHRHGW